MKIVFIGSGNVATVLGKLFHHNGLQIIQVVGRSKDNTERLASQLNCEAVLSVENITQEGDLYIIAIPDDSVTMVAEHLKLAGKMVVHTAGTLPLNTIQNISEKTGVIWPLQSLRKEIEKVPEIPFVIDGCNNEVIDGLNKFLAKVSDKIIQLKDEERVKLHLSAVLVSNFTNHLYALAQKYCTENNLPYQFLNPLITETAERLNLYDAKQVQTGPSIRGDDSSIKTHLKLLQSDESLTELYKQFDKSIRKISQ